jgi:hypothetical protein
MAAGAAGGTHLTHAVADHVVLDGRPAGAAPMAAARTVEPARARAPPAAPTWLDVKAGAAPVLRNAATPSSALPER